MYVCMHVCMRAGQYTYADVGGGAQGGAGSAPLTRTTPGSALGGAACERVGE